MALRADCVGGSTGDQFPVALLWASIRPAPNVINRRVLALVTEVIDGLRSVSNHTSALRLGEDMIAKTVCRHAVKANDPLRYLEVEKLITDLLECDLPYCCPHGRPTMIQISLAELEKKFGRKV